MYYRVKRDLKIKKLLKAYSEDKNIDYGAFRFLYNGQRMNANKTPIEVICSYICMWSFNLQLTFFFFVNCS